MTVREQTYPSRVEIKKGVGNCLVATQDLDSGVVVQKFEGEVVDYDSLSNEDKIYVLNFQVKGTNEWKWLNPRSNARYANHSCDPNIEINDGLELVTQRPVKAGEELCFVYNNAVESYEWDPLWTFPCACGSANCQGMIDRYRLLSPKDNNPPQERKEQHHVIGVVDVN